MSLFSRRKASSPPPAAPAPTRADASVKDGDLVTPMRLEDFLRQVAILLQLPPRSLKAAEKPLAAVAAAAKRIKAPVTRWALPVAATICLGAFAVSKLQPAPPLVVPPNLLGTWTTQQGAYKGKKFTITNETIVLSMGGADAVHKLLTFAAADHNDTTTVKLTYDADGKPTSMGLNYTVGGGKAAIVLDHPWDIVWHRENPDSLTSVASAPQSP